MSPEELFEAVKTAVIRKKINLVQKIWGITSFNSLTWILSGEDRCACVFGALLVGEKKEGSSLKAVSCNPVKDIELKFGLTAYQTDSVLISFDTYPEVYEGNEWTEVGFRIAEWADENGCLKKTSLYQTL